MMFQGDVSFFFLLLLFWLTSITAGTINNSTSPPPLVGQASAVYDLLDRVLGGAPHPFRLEIQQQQPGGNLYFQLQDTTNGKTGDEEKNSSILVKASTASELSAGVGWYLRHYCNMTLGWPRGGGSRVVIPQAWPQIGSQPLLRPRQVPWSYLMVSISMRAFLSFNYAGYANMCSDLFRKNVCTHSYSLVWYDQNDWERFIDWLALSGINMMLALTGQEEIQYQVFESLGLNDLDIRTWFNGPAFLTWSRGQNEYGNNICGPLPRSWMKDQFDMQQNFILPRLRSLGIVGQLPGFQGNVPIQIQKLYPNSNMTQQGMTGWMDSLDPLYGKIADLYMGTIIDAFGTDHWYQLDGYFNGGTAPWITEHRSASGSSIKLRRQRRASVPQKERSSLPAPQLSHNDAWFQRGLNAYGGLNRTDPKAIWSFQGFSFIGWNKPEEAQALRGFIDAAPKNKFVIIDMSYTGLGEWQKWNNASFFGAPFIWTALHNFGGTDGIKGDMSRLNHIPFDLSETSIMGLGGTPEGIDQNPAYYEFIFDANFRNSPVHDLSGYMERRSLARYGLNDKTSNMIIDAHIRRAWRLLMESLHSNDFSVQDATGIAHLQPRASLFEDDRQTPKPILCKAFSAWEHMLEAVQHAGAYVTKIFESNNEPFHYDLVNLGREILAQLSVAAALDFANATDRQPLDKIELQTSAEFYLELLSSVDILVGTSVAFLLGPWIESARKWGVNSNDCLTIILDDGDDCQHFYEWNARTQITTWNPTPKNSSSIPRGPIDYAGKHWSGLIHDYYGARVVILLDQALRDEASASKILNKTEVNRLFANHAYQWTTDTKKKYPTAPTGDALLVSKKLYRKYKHRFAACKQDENIA